MTLVTSYEQPNTSVAEPFPLCLQRQLGAVVSPTGTQFALWAPTAVRVTLRLFTHGSVNEHGSAILGQYAMRLEPDGSWVYDFADNKHGVYYDFLIHRECGSIDRVVDPWARAAGVNGRRSMVVDLSRTDPEDWNNDHTPETPLSQTIVWETHVGDFSNDPAGGFPRQHRGKYLAFTDINTSLEGHPDFPTGIAYLKRLGVTAVQLMPIQDYGSVDETTGNRYNWGYDPVNYNVPEGSYATNPYDGAVRIRECKQMIQALHNAGLKVIMDVVYNHMFTPDNWFERSVPEYFLRRKPNGALANGSGCGCDMATERLMFRRFVVESVVYWAKEYHVDGFRFDLMGLMDVETMNAVRAALDEIPERGRDIIMYGEPWAAGASAPLPGTVLADKEGLQLLSKRIGHFCDTTRDAIKGHVFYSDRPGFVNGGECATAGKVRQAVNAWRTSLQPEGEAGQIVQYVSAHDDLTLWDKLCASICGQAAASTAAANGSDRVGSSAAAKAVVTSGIYNAQPLNEEERVAIERIMMANRMAAGIVMTSAGMPFMLSGEEFARTKYGNEDSYDSSRELNWIDWNRAYQMRNMVDYYARLIALRKENSEWLDAQRMIVATSGDELVFRVNEFAVFANPTNVPIAVNVANIADASAAKDRGDDKQWHIVLSSSEIDSAMCDVADARDAVDVCDAVDVRDNNRIIVPPQTFAIWQLR